ncbi:MAG: hypothetical protein KC468_20185, partial [Myxococcales bacterium]|nr:hypothetical protein [Myxococcales bacterium]
RAHFMMNGYMMNGYMMNGVQQGGGEVDGLSIVSIDSGPNQGMEPITEVVVDGITGELTLTTASNKVISGLDVLGTTWTYAADVDPDTQPFQLTIYDVDYYPAGIFTGGALYVYTFTTSYWDPQADDWSDPDFEICTDGVGNPVGALMIPGKWDEATGDRVGDGTDLTIACRRAALAKCVEWGYRIGDDDPVASDQHQACTRMVRADYLGIGQPYTLNGTLIYVGDQLGINYQDDHGSSTTKEADWGPDGAYCIERFYLRQREALTECTGIPNTQDCWQGQGGEPNIPDCAASDLDPETAGAIVTAVPHAYEDEHTVGMVWQNPSLVAGVYSRDPAGTVSFGTDTIGLAAGETLDGLVRHHVYGYRAFRNDTVGGSARLVAVWSNGDLEDVGSSIPGRQFHGAATVAEDDGRTIFALDDAGDQLCRVAMLTGELLGCDDVVDVNDATFDITSLSDLTADDAEGSSFTMVNGGVELYTLARDGGVWKATQTGAATHPLNGVAHTQGGVTVGMSYTDNNFIDVSTGVKLSNAGNGGSLIAGDLGALPIGAPSSPLGQGPEGVVDGVCGLGESPAAKDCDGICDAGDHEDSVDCGDQGFCNQYDGRAITVQSDNSALYLSPTPGGDAVGASSAGADERWDVECTGAGELWLIASDGQYLKANNNDDVKIGTNPENTKRQWIPLRNPNDTWTLLNKGRGKYLAIGANNVNVGPTWGVAKHMRLVDVDLDAFCTAYGGQAVTIQSDATDRYLDSDGDDGVGSQTAADTSWTVTCERAFVTIRSGETGDFLSALSGGAGADVRENLASGPTERCLPVDNGDGTWSLQSKPRATFLRVHSGTFNAEQQTSNGAEERLTLALAQ